MTTEPFISNNNKKYIKEFVVLNKKFTESSLKKREIMKKIDVLTKIQTAEK